MNAQAGHECVPWRLCVVPSPLAEGDKGRGRTWMQQHTLMQQHTARGAESTNWPALDWVLTGCESHGRQWARPGAHAWFQHELKLVLDTDKLMPQRIFFERVRHFT